MQNPTVLFGVLDWGLGHASRSVPIIRELISRGALVHVASSGRALQLLQQQFPELTFHDIPGYNVSYRLGHAALDVILQVKKIKRSIRREVQWADQFYGEVKPDLIFSDNRYGLRHPDVPSILITHQLSPRAPKVAQKRVNKITRKLIAPFDHIWVPDYDGGNNLSGKLSHEINDERVSFVGPLSRFQLPEERGANNDIEYCIILSGPEPERTRFQEKIITKLIKTGKKSIVISGKPEDTQISIRDNVKIVAHLDDHHFVNTLLTSKKIICRSGYSTIMDLHALGLKANLIPTPGQTEQRYLAKKMEQRGWKRFRTVSDLDFETCIEKGNDTPSPNQQVSQQLGLLWQQF